MTINKKTPKELISGLRKFNKKQDMDGELFDIVLNSLNDALFIAELKNDRIPGKFILVNDVACRRLGYSKEEFLSMTPADIYPEDQRLFIASRLGKIAVANTDVFETEHVTRDGTIIPVELSTAITGFKGKTVIVSVARDITLRKHDEEKFKKAFKNSPDAIIITRASDGMLIDVNEAFLRISGFKIEEVVGKTTKDILLWADPGDRIKYIALLQEKRTLRDFETKLSTKSGELRDTVVSAELFTINDETYIIGIIHDVTESKLTQQALSESEERLRLSTELANVAVWEYDFDSNSTSRSVNHDRLYGLEWQDHWDIDTFAGAIHPDDKELSFAIFDNSVKPGGPDKYTFDFRVVFPDNTVHWLNMVGEVTKRDPNGTGKIVRGCLIDITERKYAEEKLTLSEELFHNAFHEGPAAMTITRVSDGMFIDANLSFLRMLGFKREEVVGHTSAELTLWGTEEHEKIIKEQLETGGLNNCEMVATSSSGENIYILFSSRLLVIDNEECLLTTMIDTTDKKLAENRVRSKDIQFRQLSSHLPDLIFQFLRHPDGRYSVPIASEGIKNIFGCKPEDVVDDFSPIASVIHPEDMDRILSEIEISATEQSYFSTEFRVNIPGREQQWILCQSSPEVLDDGSVLWHGFSADITYRKNAEQKMQEMKEILEDLNQHLINIREEERASISRNIHDQLGQSLTAIKLDIDWLSRKNSKDSKEGEKIEVMSRLVSGMIRDVQRISSELRPAILDDFGLAAAIEWYCEEYADRTGIKIQLDLDEIGDIDMEVNLTLYRILQESLTNVIRHAGAKNVYISLGLDGVDIEMIVRDDGVGIPEDKVLSAKSMGILGMRERVKHTGGDLEITSARGGGTTIIIRIPLI